MSDKLKQTRNKKQNNNVHPSGVALRREGVGIERRDKEWGAN